MLRGLLELFTQTAKRPKKHLTMQTIYGSPKLPLSPIVQQHLQSQQEILRQDPQFKNAYIEICDLRPNSRLIGLTRHPRTILNGIFMYSESVRHTDTYFDIEYLATAQKANIAVFKPKQEISCLRVKDKQYDVYLVDNRAIAPVELLDRILVD